MIFSLIQSSAAHPELIREFPPDGLLSAVEQRHYWALRTLRRRQDWLLGRWTAKHLLQAVFERERGESPALDKLTIFNAPNGAPMVSTGCPDDFLLSISHRDDQAFCATSRCGHRDRSGLRGLGADIERIERRSAGFVNDYLATEEIAHVPPWPGDLRDRYVAAIWSAKEATLKALRLGLTVDTRAVICLIEPRQDMPHEWVPFQVCFEAKHLTELGSTVKGWWQTYDNYVLTLVAVTESADLPIFSNVQGLGREAIASWPSPGL